MHRTAIGVGVGLFVGFICGFAVGQIFVRRFESDWASASLGVESAGMGAIAGAVIGGIADLLAFFRQALLDLRGGPEADYREPKSASNP